ncbi:hypothetical protein QYE76_044917 [Lolium multiflorum]|uniref:Filament-like plant protein 4 n=1 Tax=Lolium multiflorum TaxID=4521 RepID=A0AAD8TJK4_LOLMU|nr:hypothetical protein QYE76_044917 [Lolium multiflorum]
MEDALRSCTDQLLLVREENECLIIEAANRISLEQKKSRDLLHKLEAANKRFAKVVTENYNLHNTVNSKEKLIRELNESKAQSEQRLSEATAKLEFMQKQCTSLQYEVRIVQKELEIRNKERGYDLQSIDAAQKQQQESAHKIITLEAECRRLRTMVQNRLPGPAALVKMKDVVEQRGSTSSAENGTRRIHTSKIVQPSLRAATRRHSVSEGYIVKLQDMDDENNHLRQLLATKEREIQSVQLQYADEACKLSVVQRQLKELCSDHYLEQSNNSDQFASPLVSKPGKLRIGKQHTSLSQSRRIAVTDMQLLVDLAEIEKLEMESRPSSEAHQCRTDSSDKHSKVFPSEIVGRDQISEDGFFDKYPELIQDVLKLIIHIHQANKISVDVILDDITRALRSDVSAKEKDVVGLSYQQTEIDSMVATMIEKISCMLERTTGNNVTISQLILRERNEFTSQMEHLVHVCSDALDGKANLQKFIDEVCLTLECAILSISAAAEKLAECQETMMNLSKRLRALQTPANADASGKEKPGTLPLSAPKVLAEEDAKPADFSSPSSEEMAQKKQQGGTVAIEKDLVHEQGADTSHKTGNIGLRHAAVPLVIPRLPRITFSSDTKKKKKKRRTSLLSRLVFRNKAMLGC